MRLRAVRAYKSNMRVANPVPFDRKKAMCRCKFSSIFSRLTVELILQNSRRVLSPQKKLCSTKPLGTPCSSLPTFLPSTSEWNILAIIAKFAFQAKQSLVWTFFFQGLYFQEIKNILCELVEGISLRRFSLIDLCAIATGSWLFIYCHTAFFLMSFFVIIR